MTTAILSFGYWSDGQHPHLLSPSLCVLSLLPKHSFAIFIEIKNLEKKMNNARTEHNCDWSNHLWVILLLQKELYIFSPLTNECLSFGWTEYFKCPKSNEVLEAAYLIMIRDVCSAGWNLCAKVQPAIAMSSRDWSNHRRRSDPCVVCIVTQATNHTTLTLELFHIYRCVHKYIYMLCAPTAPIWSPYTQSC